MKTQKSLTSLTLNSSRIHSCADTGISKMGQVAVAEKTLICRMGRWKNEGIESQRVAPSDCMISYCCNIVCKSPYSRIPLVLILHMRYEYLICIGYINKAVGPTPNILYHHTLIFLIDKQMLWFHSCMKYILILMIRMITFSPDPLGGTCSLGTRAAEKSITYLSEISYTIWNPPIGLFRFDLSLQ